MSTTRKKRPVKYEKVLAIYHTNPAIERKVEATMAAHGFTSVSEAIRYQLEHRRVDTHFLEYSLDDAMWVLSAARKELQLLKINVIQIKKKLAQIKIMHADEDLIDIRLFEDANLLMDVKIKKIFDIIAKLSYIWLPK